jgi:2-pyrone-4,6-dicarboxylate lactonase
MFQGNARSLCPAPAPASHPPRRMRVPAGAVDTHSHVIGSPPEYPFVEDRTYTPPPASPESYIRMLDQTGTTYGVLIQVSVHGSDNRLLLRTLRRFPDRLRGVAVTPLDRPRGDYKDMKAAGVRGLRLNVLFGGGIGLERIEKYDELALEMGWHIQLLIDARELPTLSPRLKRLKALVAFVRDGGWVKLSGGFRNTVKGRPYLDTVPYARALIEAAPDRCLWGSDWPHVAHWGHMMTVGDLLDLLVEWAPDEKVRNRILVENPARLYGFPACAAS